MRQNAVRHSIGVYQDTELSKEGQSSWTNTRAKSLERYFVKEDPQLPVGTGESRYLCSPGKCKSMLQRDAFRSIKELLVMGTPQKIACVCKDVEEVETCLDSWLDCKMSP